MTVTDITEHKEFENALAALNRSLTDEVAIARVEQQMRRLADILEASPDLVGMADPQARVLYLNRSFSALGRSPEREPLRIADCHPPASQRIIIEEGLPTAARHRCVEGRDRFLT